MPLQVIQTIEGDLEVAVVTSGDGTARKLGFFAQPPEKVYSRDDTMAGAQE